MKNKKLIGLILIIVAFTGALNSLGQTKSRKKLKRQVEKTEQTAPITDKPSETINTAEKLNKKNQRSAEEKSEEKHSTTESKELYLYEFEAEQFRIKRIRIEHDEAGRGSISFWKSDVEEEISEPLKLSTSVLQKIKNLFNLLSFLESNEDYQSKQHDYKHLGTVKISLKVNEKHRSVSFNWTENKTAKDLANEYQKISNQRIWIFEMNLARENQPLEAPDSMKKLELYVSRNEISDPTELLPYLEELVNDEKIPLIARNHAARIAKRLKERK